MMYRYIVRYKRRYAGDSPSRREIAKALGLSSTSMVQHYLRALEKAGRIERPEYGQARRLVIPGAEWRFEEARVAGDEPQTEDDESIVDEAEKELVSPKMG
jgi:SOS-response transcriptional repressor LexA